MNRISSKELCEFSTRETTKEFEEFLDKEIDIEIRSQIYGEVDHEVITNEAGNFAKWIKQNHDSYSVDLPLEKDKLVLYGSEIILPLVFLSSQVGLPLFLNMVSNYLFDRLKGSLSNDVDIVEVEVLSKDNGEGKTKYFKYKGPVEGLQKIAKKLDLDKFMED